MRTTSTTQNREYIQVEMTNHRWSQKEDKQKPNDQAIFIQIQNHFIRRLIKGADQS